MQNICPSTHKNANVFVRTLHEACLILGGEDRLAAYLGVEVALIDRWLAGHGRPPDDVFVRCADLVHEHALKPRGRA